MGLLGSLGEGLGVLAQVLGVELQRQDPVVLLHHGLDVAAVTCGNLVESQGHLLDVVLVVFRHDPVPIVVISYVP